MNIVYLLLGSNMDNRAGMLRLAKEAIQSRLGVISRESSIYETEPWGIHSGDLFLNQVIRIETDYLPAELMDEILRIEEDLGRKRRQLSGYMPRTIDIDILFYNDEIIQDEHLIIPHPRMQERMFVLIPLSEIDHMLTHPASNKTIRQLIAECQDQLKVNCYHGK